MNKYNNPRLLNTVVSGTGMKHPMQPHVVVGDTANGFIRGDLMDANAIVELINNIIGGAPDTLDTLKEAADRIAALEHDTRDWLTQDDTLASKVDGLFKSLQILQHSEEDDDREDTGLIFKFFTERFDKHAENRYEEYFIPQATSTRNGVMSSAQAQALEEASAASAEIPQIKQTIEDNELTVAAALSDLNSRINDIDLQSIIDPIIDQLDGEDGLVNLVSSINTKLNKVYNTLMPLEFGDYLLSDLKTKVRQANITEAQKADVVGICIGQNPYTKKDIFVNVDGLINLATVKFCTSDELPEGVFTTYASSEQTGTIGTNKINDEVLLNDTAKIAGKITATCDISVTSGDYIYQVNDFAGLHNTIEWAKQAKAANGTIDQYPALQRTLGYSGITSFDDVDDSYNGWFLASTGYAVMMCPSVRQKNTVSLANYNSLKTAVQNLGKTWSDAQFYGGSFCNQSSDHSYVHYLSFKYGTQAWNNNYVGASNRLFALIER